PVLLVRLRQFSRDGHAFGVRFEPDNLRINLLLPRLDLNRLVRRISSNQQISRAAQQRDGRDDDRDPKDSLVAGPGVSHADVSPKGTTVRIMVGKFVSVKTKLLEALPFLASDSCLAKNFL